MNDYIKREDALRKIDSIDDHDDDVRANALGLAAFAVTTVPTADVVEVRHGRWLRVGQSYIDPNKFLCFECSICRCTLDNHIKVEQNYCPNCGARMDGDKE